MAAILFSSVFVDNVSTNFGLKENSGGILSSGFSLCGWLCFPAAVLGREWTLKSHQGGSCMRPICLAGRNQSWKPPQGQELSSCPQAPSLPPSQPCHPICISLAPSELNPSRALGVEFGGTCSSLSQRGFNLSVRNESALTARSTEKLLF